LVNPIVLLQATSPFGIVFAPFGRHCTESLKTVGQSLRASTPPYYVAKYIIRPGNTGAAKLYKLKHSELSLSFSSTTDHITQAEQGLSIARPRALQILCHLLLRPFYRYQTDHEYPDNDPLSELLFSILTELSGSIFGTATPLIPFFTSLRKYLLPNKSNSLALQYMEPAEILQYRVLITCFQAQLEERYQLLLQDYQENTRTLRQLFCLQR
jgi:hypothetical protein